MPLELNVLALLKSSHRYVYVFDDASRRELMRYIESQANDPDTQINWLDAAVLDERSRRQVKRAGDSV